MSSLCISTEGSDKNAWRTKHFKFVEEMLTYRLPIQSDIHSLETALRCLSRSFTRDLRSCLPFQMWLEDERLVVSYLLIQ